MRLTLLLAFLLSCTICVFSQSASLPSQFQSWNEVQLIVPIARSKDAKRLTKLQRLLAEFCASAEEIWIFLTIEQARR